LLAQLAAYEDLLKTLPQGAPEGAVMFRAKLPSTLEEALRAYLASLHDREVANSLERLYACLKEVGRGVLAGLKSKSLKEMHEALTEYLSLKVLRQ
jgi:hypothetical protein